VIIRTSIAAAALLASTSLCRAQTLPLHATVTQDEGLMKHLYSFALPPGRYAYTGLTGAVSFAASMARFGESLASVNYYDGPASCSSLNNTEYASYQSPGFPPLTHLAAAILKTSVGGVVTQRIDAHNGRGVPLSGCIVVVLDGGGAWGPQHSYGYTVTMTSSLTLHYRPLADGVTPGNIALPIGGEVDFGPSGIPTSDGWISITQINPASTTAWGVNAIYGSVSVSAFDGSSGETVPTGYWGAREAAVYYPAAACTAAFGALVAGPWPNPINTTNAQITASALPTGGTALNTQSLPGSGQGYSQATYAARRPARVVLQPGDCLVSLMRATSNGDLDAEDQSTAILAPRSAR
jgi:hypothetical protein